MNAANNELSLSGLDLPRKNGELVFEAPWQSTAFGLAAAVVEHQFSGDRDPSGANSSKPSPPLVGVPVASFGEELAALGGGRSAVGPRSAWQRLAAVDDLGRMGSGNNRLRRVYRALKVP